MKSILFPAAALFAVASTAHAADLDPVPTPDPLPAYDWSGFYLGIAGGWFGANAKNRLGLEVEQEGFEPLTESWGPTTKPSGGMFGGYAGYNWQMPDSNIVLGVEGDFYGVNAKKNRSVSTIAEIDSTDIELTLAGREKINSTWAVRGRLGWAFDDFMPYIAGGFAGASMKSTLGLNAFDTEAEETLINRSTSSTKTYTGWTIGAGMEWMVTEDWALRVDYQHKDLSKKNNLRLSDSFEGIDYSVVNRTKLKSDQVTIGGAFKF